MDLFEALIHSILEAKPVYDLGQGHELTQMLTELAGMIILAGLVVI